MLDNQSTNPADGSERGRPSAGSNSINSQRAFWVAVIFTTVAFSSFLLSIFLNFQYPAWQVFLMAVIAGLSLAFDAISLVLIRRGRTLLALRILYWSILVVLPLNV